MIRPLPYIISIAFYLCTETLFSQISGELIEQTLNVYSPFTIIQYSTKEGLPQNQVLDIIQDENGELILSTANGIVRFNGQEFKPFITIPNYKANRFKKLFWHSKSGILCGISYDDSFLLIHPINYFIAGQSVRYETICDAYLDNDRLWLFSKEGRLFLYEYGDRYIQYIHSFEKGRSSGMAFNHPYLYIASENGLIQFDITLKQGSYLLPKHQFVTLQYNEYNQSVYGCTREKLYKLEPYPRELFNIHDRNHSGECRDIAFQDSSVVYLGTSKGLYIVDPFYPEHFTRDDGIPSNYCSSLCYDQKEACLFIGTDEKGLLKLQTKNAYSFYTSSGLSESSLSSVIKSKDNRVLVAGNCCNIYQINPDTVLKYTALEANYSSLAEIEGVIYAGTWGNGLMLIKDQRLFKIIRKPDLPNNFVHSSFIDSKGNTWIGTSNGMAKGKNHTRFQPFLLNEIQGLILNIQELSNGIICVGGSEGVFLIRNNQLIKKIGRADGLKGKEVRAIKEDQEGKLWIGTYDGGIYCYHNGKLTSINSMPGCMLDIDAFCFAPDEYGLWNVTSNHGLWRIRYKDLNDFYHGRLNYLVPFHYDQENGILNPEFNGGFQNNYLKTNNDHFYFPTIEGIVMVSPEKLPFRKLNPSITKVIINDTLINNSLNIFERNTYSIQFEFTCTNYLNKYNIYYQHKLEGEQNTEWSSLQKSNNVHLKMLPPGTYTLKVRAIDGFNDRNPKEAIYTFTIRPYIYETLLFRLMILFIITSLISIVIIERVLAIRRKAEKKELAKRQLFEFELKAIQAQMSPHFIFNCLNSIKYFVVSGQKESANRFLDHFSLLIRKFLETSDLIEVSVDQEASMLSEYLSLEKMRMGNQLNFKIMVSPECKDLKIPTMLTQPYVENAIKHGIAHKDGEGTILVTFELVTNSLICHIQDDGIGRKRGMEISELNRKHIPKGMGLVREKSEILKSLYKKEIEIEIKDLFNDSGIASGTLVIIKIPI